MGVPLFVVAPPLSVDNVMKTLESLTEQWDTVGGCLHIPSAVRQRVRSECSNDTECLRRVIRYWLLRDPFASWRRLLRQLDCANDDEFRKVADSIRSYVERLDGQ